MNKKSAFGLNYVLVLAMLFVFTACKTDKVSIVEDSVSFCQKQDLSHKTCTDFDQGQALAVQVASCDNETEKVTYKECELRSCQQGYALLDSKCEFQTCQAGQALSSIPCTDDIEHAHYAEQVKTCDDTGTSEIAGSCELVSCKDGFVKDGNVCVPFNCEAGSDYATADCTQDIEFAGLATANQTCNDAGDGLLSGSCELQYCKNDYVKVGNICEPKACNIDQDYGRVRCEDSIVGASYALQSKTCNSLGTDFEYGSCELQHCKQDFYEDGNTCKPDVCEQSFNSNTDNVRECTEEIVGASYATEITYCNLEGSAIENTGCKVQSCKAGFTMNSDRTACIETECVHNQDYGKEACELDLPHVETAFRTKKCDGWGNFQYGECMVESCVQGDGITDFYVLENNVCKELACEPNREIGRESCKNEIPGALEAFWDVTCKADGNGYDYGECQLEQCAEGFYRDGNTCKAMICQPNEILEPELCTDEISNSFEAFKSKQCNAEGSGYVYGQCELKSCTNGTHKKGNVCETCNESNLNLVADDNYICTDKSSYRYSAPRNRSNGELLGFIYRGNVSQSDYEKVLFTYDMYCWNNALFIDGFDDPYNGVRPMFLEGYQELEQLYLEGRINWKLLGSSIDDEPLQVDHIDGYTIDYHRETTFARLGSWVNSVANYPIYEPTQVVWIEGYGKAVSVITCKYEHNAKWRYNFE